MMHALMIGRRKNLGKVFELDYNGNGLRPS
jgi:hypothetical protein